MNHILSYLTPLSLSPVSTCSGRFNLLRPLERLQPRACCEDSVPGLAAAEAVAASRPLLACSCKAADQPRSVCTSHAGSGWANRPFAGVCAVPAQVASAPPGPPRAGGGRPAGVCGSFRTVALIFSVSRSFHHQSLDKPKKRRKNEEE